MTPRVPDSPRPLRIAIDLQAVQRGWQDPQAVEPVLETVRELLEGRVAHEVVLVLDGAMQASALALRNEFRARLPAMAVRAWRAPALSDRPLERGIAGLIREGCLAALNADVVVVPVLLDHIGELVVCAGTIRRFRTALVVPAQAPASDEQQGLLAALIEQADAVFTQRPRDGWVAALARIPKPAAGPAEPARRPRLAYVSPLAPEHTGISDYSGELLPELARHYDIDVVTNQPQVTDAWVLANCQVRSPDEFREHASAYDRVLYHVGNSAYHDYMFALLDRHPGVVVLHDFFLGHVLSDLQARHPASRAWNRALYESHGYAALEAAFGGPGRAEAVWTYPANLPVVASARGVIVHSRFPIHLGAHWYGCAAVRQWAVVPHLRVPAASDAKKRRARARKALGLKKNDFVVCSFGVVGPLKLSQRLLDAWLQSSLARDPRCTLLFVGENDGGSYGEALAGRAAGPQAGQVRITGWVDTARYREYLAAADVAVQLRTRSRGETSGAVLDCLNHGVPTIVNAHGSMADLPQDVAHSIPDDFVTQDLADALEQLQSDPDRRKRLADAARRHLLEHHAPAACAQQYAHAIEAFYGSSGAKAIDVGRAIAALGPLAPPDAQEVARAVDYSLPRATPCRQLLVDVSAISRIDLKSGIQRVVRSVLRALLDAPPPGFRVEPVYLSNEGGRWRARYARRYMLDALGCPADLLDDDDVEPDAGDVFLGLDLSGGYVVAADREQLLSGWRAKGVSVTFVVYDLLPQLMPEKFPQEEIAPFRAWLDVVARCDAAFCISQAVAQQFALWRAQNYPEGPGPFVGHFHLGADIERSAPTLGRPENRHEIVGALQSRWTFLMVGTVEPRKGHAQVLSAVEALWSQGVQCNLVVIGREGWMVEPLAARLRAHPELGRRLFWLQGISDEFLQCIYALSCCLVFASEGEGFGLPLIEAAQHGIAIVARDLPVFREVAGDNAFYFSGMEPSALASALARWLELYRQGLHPHSEGMTWLTWRESTEQLKEALQRSGVLGGTDPP